MKFFGILTTLAAAVTATCASTGYPTRKPTTIIAGVEVVDTQIVRDARAIIQKFTPYLYKHCMRTWLYGAAAINANKTLSSKIDLELHAVSTILHDLGWDMTPGSPWISPDKRFEVDGALGAQKFIKSHRSHREWDEARLEKVYDGISLHGSPGVGVGKNLDVVWILNSIAFDNPGARDPQIPEKQYNSIVQKFPNTDITYGTNETWTWLAATKPAATYNTIVEPFGTAFVPGYNAVGHRVFDFIVDALKAQHHS
ncbi:hypothetical protein F5Y17DRAFT_159593 [Xylariaceae sp. FL0594]|nr:hypothetical protein F5Y17DRAFT_159593 [Xylariaceae sp. FL0594]